MSRPLPAKYFTIFHQWQAHKDGSKEDEGAVMPLA
jgi:hypothetical protein